MDSIVINTYNRPELLSRCLDNLSRQARLDEAEVIVVDDGSRGDFHAIERLWRRKMNLKFVPIKHAGAPAARNRGVAAASGERVIFLGDDVFVRPGWLARHLDQGRGNPLIAIIGPYPLENHPDYSASFLKWAESFHLSRIKDPTNAGFALFGTGNASMDRAKFLEIGGFDERFIYYGWEDLDLAYRFEKGGGRIIFDAEAKAIHNHPYLKRSDLWQRELKSGMNAYLFWDKWRNGDVEYM
ncbi:glycosyltransferase, partial [Candidatus Sumerlaeota bacterium]|nr:glycosyltransferase [Candidatus Sumerlaeota bacterium]